MRYFIIGLPGVGKSAFSSLLAQKMHIEFIDLDAMIQTQTGLTIPQIFQQGEKVFREFETTILATLISDNKEVIIACGGGTPCFNNNMQFMKNNGIVVYLKADIDVITQRLQEDTINVRPLLLPSNSASELIKEKLQSLYVNRKDDYEEADLIINWNMPLENQNFETIIDEIINFTKDEYKRN